MQRSVNRSKKSTSMRPETLEGFKSLSDRLRCTFPKSTLISERRSEHRLAGTEARR